MALTNIVPQPTAVNDDRALVRERYVSVDAARGYAMFILIAMGPLHRALQPFAEYAFPRFILDQISHSEWNGWTYLDGGFGSFLVAMGLAMAVSLQGRIDRGVNKFALFGHVVRRAAVLFVLGIILNGGFAHSWPDVRLMGVLQRIAICFVIGTGILLVLRAKGQAALLVALLLGYWAILAWVPVPGYGAGDYSFEGNVCAYVDRLWLPGAKSFREYGWDQEGILSTLGAVSTTLIGILLGQYVLRRQPSVQEKVLWVMLAGFVCLFIGAIWWAWLPSNKAMWTPTYVMISAGCTLTHYAVFMQICDVWKKNWFFPLIVLGMNSLLTYILNELVPFHDYSLRLVGGDVARIAGQFGPIVISAVEMAMIWGVLYFCYRRGLILKA